ncbi:MAG: hypothetical protein GC161_15765 [Planctomycetaceae bacterium]|nr:hypothetical protein [Planctomycetaceae bacterium]
MNLATSILWILTHAAQPAPYQDTPPPAAIELAAELAAWELAAATDGDDDRILARIEALVERARAAREAAPGDAALRDAVARVESARTRFRLARGLDAPGAGGTSAPRSAGLGTPEDVVVEQTVRVFLSSDDTAGLMDLGALAVPHLAAIAREMTPASANGLSARALFALGLIDASTALDVVADLAAQESLLVRRKLGQFLGTRLASQLSASRYWVSDERGNVHLAKENWNQITDRLLAEPGLDVGSLEHWLYAGARWGHVASSAAAALLAADAAQGWPAVDSMHEGLRPLYEAGLAHADADVRRLCIAALRGSLDTTAVYALAADPDPAVRVEVARTLAPHSYHPWIEPDRDRVLVQRVPEPNSSWRWALHLLLRDEDETARNAALEGAIAKRPDGIAVLTAPELLDLDRVVTEPATLVRLYEVVLQRHRDMAAEVLRRAFAHSARRDAPSTRWDSLLRPIVERPDQYPGTAVGMALLDGLERLASRDLWHVAVPHDPDAARVVPPLPDWLRRLDDLARVRALRALHAVDPIAAWRIATAMPTGEQAEPWRALMGDASADSVLRLCAAPGAIAPTGGVEQVDFVARAILDAMPRFLGEPWPDDEKPLSEGERAGRLSQLVQDLAGRLAASGQPASELLVRLVREPGFPRAAVERITLPDVVGEPAADLVRAVMARFPDFLGSRQTELLAVLMSASAALPTDERHAFWAQALAGNTWVQQAALRAIRASRDLGAVDLLREASTRPNISYHGFADTAAALGGDAAARLLLDLAASAPNRETRAAVAESLDQLLALQEAEARWQRRQDAAAVRERAIAELVQLLDSADTSDEQKVESVRGLALLEAVEELPRLVRLLVSPSPALAEAARESLARLHLASGDGTRVRAR